MSGTRTATVLSVMLLIVGCAPSIERIAPGNPLMGQSVQVQEFDVSSAQVTSFEGPTKGYGMEVAEQVAYALRHAGVNAASVPRGTPLQGSSIVEGQVTKIDGGRRALRYWISFGAGATQFAVRGTVHRADGRQLGQFADERRSGFGVFGGASDDLIHVSVKEVGYDVANMITTGQYRQE